MCGFLSMIGGVLTPFLPSDYHRPLPNVAIEVEKSLILEDSSRRKKSRHLATPYPRMVALVDMNSSHFDEEQENEKNNTLLELSVQEFQPHRLQAPPQDLMSHLRHAPGPSRLCQTSDKSSSMADKDDTESRLTDLEEELCKIWEQNAIREGENTSGSPRDFRRTNVRDHYLRMHETQF
ncbi:hypothetical protein X975_26401, partial [Stegodyphus mimosarum]